MYNLPNYKEQDRQVVYEFMRNYPFAIITGTSAQGMPVATHVPLLIKEREDGLYLQGHIMKQTDHHKAFEHNKQALAIFSGPHAYVSASWYENKQQASTWNYMTVHAGGEINFLDAAALPGMLDELTAYFEQNPASPSLYKELPEAYLERLLKAIVAFEIRVTSLEHVFKLSQNRDQKSFEHIITQLQQRDADSRAVAAEMEKRKKDLFGN